MPEIPSAKVMTLEEIQADGKYRKGYKLMSGRDTLADSLFC